MPSFTDLLHAHRRRLAQPPRRPRSSRPSSSPSALGRTADARARRRRCPARDALDGAYAHAARSSTTTSGAGSAGAEVPADDEPRAAAAGPRRTTARRRRSAMVADVARRHGVAAACTTTSAAASPATRSTPSGWSPTSRRCSTTRRCWPASTSTPGRSPASRATARCSTRRSATCCATCATPTAASTPPRTPTPRARRASSTSGRPTRSARPCSATTTPPTRPSGTASPTDGNFEGATSSTAPRARRPAAAADDRGGRAGACSTAREQRVRPGLDDKVLTEWNALMLSTLAEAAAATGDADWLDGGGRATASSCSRPAARRRPLAAVVAGRRGGCARHLAYAADHAAWSTPSPAWPRPPARPAGSPRRAATADALLDLFWDDERRRAVHHRRRRRAARHPAEGPARQRHAVGQQPRRGRPAPARRAHRRRPLPRARRGRSSRLLGRLAAEHPTAFAHLLAAVDLLRRRHRPRSSSPATGPTSCGRCTRASCPNAVLAWGERYDSPLWEGRDEPAAYVCRDYACQLPSPHGRRRWSPSSG